MRKGADRIELSPREQQLIAMAGEGLTDTAIAHRLGISEATVNTYWGRIRVKLGPHNRTELVALALKEQYELQLEEIRSGSTNGAPDYSMIIQAAPDAMLIIAEDGTIEEANIAAADLFGYETGELVGHQLHDLLPERYRHDHGNLMAEYLAANPERRAMSDHMAVTGLKKTGEELSIAASISAIDWHGRSMGICSIRPAH